MNEGSGARRAAVTEWLAEQQEAMRALLALLVDIDSHSHDKAGVDSVGEAISDWCKAMGIEVRRTPRPRFGDLFEACLGEGEGAVVLLGHRDTVFPTGTVAERSYEEHDGMAFGPGVADMKGGLVMNLFVLAALARTGGLAFPLKAVFTADEEIGSPDGKALIEAAVRHARAVFNAEPGRVSGNLVTARKGGASLVLEVSGRAAHSGVSHADGASAIEALARKIQRIHALTDYDTGVTTNVGVIEGGTSSNTVAPWARARIDTRFVTSEQREALFAALEEIAAREELPGTQATLTQVSGFLPLEREMSEALLARYQRSAAELGFEVEGEFTGGCSDAGTTASLGIPTLCGTGPVGALMHTEREYLLLSSLVPRAQALALTLLDLDEA